MKLPVPLILALLLTAKATPDARAQQAAPIYVAFHFDEPRAVRNFETDALRETAEKEISLRLVDLFQRQFKWWTFKAASSDQQVPRCDVRLAAVLDWQVSIEFTSALGVPSNGLWSGVLFKPVDYENSGSLLRREGWGPSVERQIKQNILNGRSPEILVVLQKNAPLGYGAILPQAPLTPENLQVVLPLDWSQYQSLGASLFTILCRSELSSVTLHTEGREIAASFTAHNPPYDGLKVTLKMWDEDDHLGPIGDHLAALGGLKPVAFFLKEHRGSWAMAGQ